MTYDATANLNYNFDQENRITGAGGYGYIYDGDGNRVEKVTPPINPTSGTLYWYMTPGIVAESDLNGNLKSEYVFFDGERVARKDFPGNTVAYYFSDHLKTASIITDSAGNIKADSDYYPWGGELQFVANDSNHYKFTGKERDGETGLDYFGAHYYSNGLGRWVSADWSATPVPVPYADFEDPQTLNQYSYVRNTPTVKVDANGHCFWDVCVGETIVVVTAITATAAYLSTPSDQNALKAAVHIFDKATDALAAGGNALAAGCAGSGTCLTGMKPPGGPPEYYQQNETSESNSQQQGSTQGQSGQTQGDQSSQGSKEIGSYTNTHESGKTYDGKGDRTRSQDSGKRIEKQTGDKHTATEFKSATDDREAFKDESRRLDSHGGPDSSANHNKIQSPGKKYRGQDGSK